MKNIFVILFISILLKTSFAFASSCCGQSSSSFSVMTLRQKFSIGMTQSYSNGLGRVYNDNNFLSWPNNKNRDVYLTQFNLGYKLNDLNQMFLTTGVQIGRYSEGSINESSRSLTDTLLGWTYEALPEYTYSKYKPIVYITSFVNLPTGHSVYQQPILPENLNVTGYNQWGAGVGLTLKKVIMPWTLMTQFKVLRLFAKDFDSTVVGGFWDSSIMFSVMYALNIWDLALNAAVTHLQISSRTVTYSDEFKVPKAYSNAVSIGIVKPIGDDMSISFNYSDQTLIKPAKNSLLSQTFSLNLIYNYF